MRREERREKGEEREERREKREEGNSEPIVIQKMRLSQVQKLEIASKALMG